MYPLFQKMEDIIKKVLEKNILNDDQPSVVGNSSTINNDFDYK